MVSINAFVNIINRFCQLRATFSPIGFLYNILNHDTTYTQATSNGSNDSQSQSTKHTCTHTEKNNKARGCPSMKMVSSKPQVSYNYFTMTTYLYVQSGIWFVWSVLHTRQLNSKSILQNKFYTITNSLNGIRVGKLRERVCQRGVVRKAVINCIH